MCAGTRSVCSKEDIIGWSELPIIVGVLLPAKVHKWKISRDRRHVEVEVDAHVIRDALVRAVCAGKSKPCGLSADRARALSILPADVGRAGKRSNATISAGRCNLTLGAPSSWNSRGNYRISRQCLSMRRADSRNDTSTRRKAASEDGRRGTPVTYRRLLARGCQLLVAGTLFYYAIQGLRTGRIQTPSLPSVTVVRSESPFRFWCTWVIAVAGGIVFLLVGIGFFD